MRLFKHPLSLVSAAINSRRRGNMTSATVGQEFGNSPDVMLVIHDSRTCPKNSGNLAFLRFLLASFCAFMRSMLALHITSWSHMSAQRSLIRCRKLNTPSVPVVGTLLTAALFLFYSSTSASAVEPLNVLVPTTIEVPLTLRDFPFDQDRVLMV